MPLIISWAPQVSSSVQESGANVCYRLLIGSTHQNDTLVNSIIEAPTIVGATNYSWTVVNNDDVSGPVPPEGQVNAGPINLAGVTFAGNGVNENITGSILDIRVCLTLPTCVPDSGAFAVGPDTITVTYNDPIDGPTVFSDDNSFTLDCTPTHVYCGKKFHELQGQFVPLDAFKYTYDKGYWRPINPLTPGLPD